MQPRSQSRSGLAGAPTNAVLSNGAPRSFDFAYLEPADLAGYIGGTTPFPPTTNTKGPTWARLVAHSDGGDRFGLGGQFPPCVAGSVDNGVVIFEDGV